MEQSTPDQHPTNEMSQVDVNPNQPQKSKFRRFFRALIKIVVTLVVVVLLGSVGLDTKLRIDSKNEARFLSSLTPINGGEIDSWFQGYAHDGTDVYYLRLVPSFRISSHIPIKILGVDLNTFTEFEHPYGLWGKDKNTVYYNEHALAGSDPDTFEILSTDYARDKQQGYFKQRALIGVDSSRLRMFEGSSGYLALDDNHVFDRGNVVAGAHAPTFQKESTGILRDKNHLYNPGSNNEIISASDVDASTMRAVSSIYVVDANNAYALDWNGKKNGSSIYHVINADPSTLEVSSTPGHADIAYDAYGNFFRRSERLNPTPGEIAQYTGVHPIGSQIDPGMYPVAIVAMRPTEDGFWLYEYKLLKLDPSWSGNSNYLTFVHFGGGVDKESRLEDSTEVYVCGPSDDIIGSIPANLATIADQIQEKINATGKDPTNTVITAYYINARHKEDSTAIYEVCRS